MSDNPRIEDNMQLKYQCTFTHQIKYFIQVTKFEELCWAWIEEKRQVKKWK